MQNTGDWQGQYVFWPDTDVYPDDSLYPDNVKHVTGEDDVWSKDGLWRWEKVTDISTVERMIQVHEALQETIRSIPTSLDMVVGLKDGTVVNSTVVQQLFARYVTAEQGEFVQIRAGNIAAGAIGADQIRAGAIDGFVITGATIRTGTSYPRIEMNQDGIVAYQASNKQTVKILTDGTVWARGDFGVTDAFSEAHLQDLDNSYIMAYGGGTIYTYAGCGMRFAVSRRPSNTDYTVSMSGGDGWIGPSYRDTASNNKDDGYKGALGQTGIYGVGIQSMARTSGVKSTLLVEEHGLRYSNINTASSTTSRNFSFSVAPQRFQAWSPQVNGGYRLCVEGGAQACVAFQAAASASTFSNRPPIDINFYETYWWMRNRYYWFVTNQEYSTPYMVLATGTDASGTTYRCSQLAVRGDVNGGTTTGASTSALAFYTHCNPNNNIVMTGTRRLHVSVGGSNGIAINRDSIYLVGGGATNPIRAAIVGSSSFWCSGITKNFVMQVPVLTRQKNMSLKHASTESPHNGIEYWKTGTLDDNGEFVWELPPYVQLIASPSTDRCILVTCSRGSAAAELVEDEDGWYVRVTEGSAGATVNLLLKLARVIESADGYDGEYATKWDDDNHNVWVPLVTLDGESDLEPVYGPQPPPSEETEEAEEEE